MDDISVRTATPEEIADLERRVRLKYEGPAVKRWEPILTKEQYFDRRVAGEGRQALILKYYNNESEKLAKQLREWGIRSWKEEMTEVEALAKGVKTALTITKEEYLQQRLAGETRTRVMRSLGGAPTKFYKLLEEWGIRELDAEERVLELLAPVIPASGVDLRTAELLEQKATARGLIELNAQHRLSEPVEAVKAEARESVDADQPPLEEENQQRELANLQAAVALWRHNAENEREYRLKIEDELVELREKLEQDNATAARIVEQEVELKRHIRGLEEERLMLVQTIENASILEDVGYVIIRMPVLPVTTANAERARIYDAVEALGTGVEAAEIDRERVMRELFILLQRAVSFVTADLAELLPGQDVSEHVQRFFEAHNDRHIANVTAMQEAG